MISLAVVNVVPVAIRSSTSNILIFSVLDDDCVLKTNGGNIFLNSVGILFSENLPLSPTSFACNLILKLRLLASSILTSPQQAWSYNENRDSGYANVGRGGYPTCKARRNDWSIYELTSWFEERGVLFYGEKSLKIFGGVIQIAGGYIVFRTGKIVKSSSLKGIGELAMATGTSNILELSSEIVYRITEGKYGGENKNILENSMADIYEYAGYDRRHGELTYKTIDFSVSMFFSFGALVKLNNPQRIFNLPVKTNGKMIYPSLIDRMLNPKGSFFYLVLSVLILHLK